MISAPTTSDSWVPLPVLSTINETSGTTITSQVNTTNDESASKPSITYIPLESTTMALNLSMGTVGVSSEPTSTTPGYPVNMSDFTEGRSITTEKCLIVFGTITYQTN